jgi:hypothetical protein
MRLRASSSNMEKTDPRHAISENILFQAEHWQRYGHNGLDNKYVPCDIWLYRLQFFPREKEIRLESYHFSETSGYSLINDKKNVLSTDRKQVNKVTEWNGSKSIWWECWCEGNQIEAMSIIIKHYAKKHKENLQRIADDANVPKALTNR